MEYNRLGENQVLQNPNNVPYQTNPLPSYPQNQAPYHNLPPQAPYYYPSTETPYPPPVFDIPPPVTVTLAYVPNPDPGHPYPVPNVSWGAAYGQSGAEALYSAGATLPTAATQVPNAATQVLNAATQVQYMATQVPNAATQMQYIATQVQSSNSGQRAPKKTKVVQSQWCDVCNINCNSKDALDNHKLGKKHRKNLDRLRGPPVVPSIEPAALAIVSVPAAPAIAVTSPKPIIGPPEKPNEATSRKAKKKKAKAAGLMDLESKRRKVLEVGAAPEAIRTCTYCNVVCNSEAVFSSHIAGHKHAANVKKHELLAAGVAV